MPINNQYVKADGEYIGRFVESDLTQKFFVLGENLSLDSLDGLVDSSEIMIDKQVVDYRGFKQKLRGSLICASEEDYKAVQRELIFNKFGAVY